ncbi:MAG TPA: hypothetical protein VHE13_08765 [Opitutus sp.]|nr:hypothetical protein [Opitutus sp.]
MSTPLPLKLFDTLSVSVKTIAPMLVADPIAGFREELELSNCAVSELPGTGLPPQFAVVVQLLFDPPPVHTVVALHAVLSKNPMHSATMPTRWRSLGM